MRVLVDATYSLQVEIQVPNGIPEDEQRNIARRKADAALDDAISSGKSMEWCGTQFSIPSTVNPDDWG